MLVEKKEINDNENIPVGPNDTIHHLGPLTPRVSDVGAVDVMGG